MRSASHFPSQTSGMVRGKSTVPKKKRPPIVLLMMQLQTEIKLKNFVKHPALIQRIHPMGSINVLSKFHGDLPLDFHIPLAVI